MTYRLTVLGGRHGRLLVASNEPNFGDRYAVRQGEVITRFSRAGTDPAALALGVNLLAKPNRDPAYWRLDSRRRGATLTSMTDAEWLVGHRAPWRLAVHGPAEGTTVTYQDATLGPDIPVRPDSIYEASCLLRCQPTWAQLRVSVRDEDGNVVDESSALTSGEVRDDSDLAGFERVAVRVRTPRAAHSVRIHIDLVEPQNMSAPAVRRIARRNADTAAVLFLDCAFVSGPGNAVDWGLAVGSRPILARAAAGRDGFTMFEAPAELGPGVEHVDVIDLLGSERAVEPTDTPPAVATFRPGIESQAAADVVRLQGNLVMLAVKGTHKPLGMYIDGEFVGRVRYRRIPELTPVRGTVPLPSQFCDGRVHVLEVRDQSGTRLVSRSVDILPTTTTPWQALQVHTRPPLPSWLAPAAGHRYAALRRQLERFGSSGESPATELIGQLDRAHRVLELGFESNRDYAPLHFPDVEQPTVSIVVPVHNKFNVTYFCLAALLVAANDTSFEVIVVDDGSEDETLRLGEIAPNVTVCRNETAQGFVGACNLGAANARGEYIVLLNNDTEPTVGWLDELLDAFARFDNVGLAGSKLLFADGRLQDAGGIVWNSGTPWNYGRRQNAADPRYSYARQVDYVSGAALMIPKRVWDEVQRLSTEYAPAYFEDTDLAFKVREAGYTTWFVATSIVYHFEGLSNGTDVADESGLKRFQEINRPKFQRRWASAFAHHGDEATQPDLEKDRGILGRTLFIDHGVPRPDRDAGSYAAIQEMRLVQALGHKVTFLPWNLSYAGSHTDHLNRAGIETIHDPFAGSVEGFLADRGPEFDVVYITRYSVARNVLDAVRRHAPQAKVMFCNADLHFLREARALLNGASESDWETTRQTREDELEVTRNVDLVLSYNEVEHAVILSHNLSETRVATCPWVVESVDETAVPPYGARQGLAFLGGYGHPPNVEAIDFFVENVLPKLRGRLPEAPFNIYGSQMPERFHDFTDEAINPVGWVESVAEVYNHNRVFVAPLLSGAGIKGKVLGALAHGIPSVLSQVAAEGTGVRDGYDAVIARTVDDWVDGIATLYESEEKWRAMSASAMEFAHRNYSFERGLELMREAYLRVGVLNIRH